MKSIFVTHRSYLENKRGGVQVCTNEYIEVIKAANIDIDLFTFDGDGRLSTRIWRNCFTSPYFRPIEQGAAEKIIRLAKESKPDFLFLNQVALAAIAPQLKQDLPACKIVLLSHGLESTDLLHFIRLRKRLPLSGRIRPSASAVLGHAIILETKFRRSVDIVCAISPFDVEMERWIGAQHVGWLPRRVEPRPLNWRPIGNRLGFVGTLDHAPNLEGLVEVLSELMKRNSTDVRIRVVGGPERLGKWLTKHYPVVDYVGVIEDHNLVEEAATWSAFLHPIFCQARGCSTKLATAISWQLPIITTAHGYRGYEWREGKLVTADDPRQFTGEIFRLLNRNASMAARAEVIAVCRSSPSLQDCASRLRTVLGLPK